jgi:hypothetical protein
VESFHVVPATRQHGFEHEERADDQHGRYYHEGKRADGERVPCAHDAEQRAIGWFGVLKSRV